MALSTAVFLVLCFASTVQGAGECLADPPGGFSQDDAAEMVRLTNEKRQLVASGGSGQPAAANMRQLVWDADLAATAQTWADNCEFKHDTNDVRKTTKYPNAGQNIKLANYDASNPKPDSKAAVDDFYNEISKFTSSVDNYVFGMDYGHYSQLVWAETEAVGCGYRVINDPTYKTSQLIVCNYGPTGNYPNEKVYIQGTRCSKCSGGGKCSSEFNALCTGGTSDGGSSSGGGGDNGGGDNGDGGE